MPAAAQFAGVDAKQSSEAIKTKNKIMILEEVDAMKGKIASKVVDHAVEAEKQKLKKKAKKRVRSFIFKIFGTCFVFSLGVFAGIHWRVIRALIMKTELPELPEGHCHQFCKISFK